MYNLYDRIIDLCDNMGIKPGKMCNDLSFSRGMMTDLKMGRKQSLSTDTLSKISDYFGVTVNFLIARPPFDYWTQINRDRSSFMHFFLQCWERPVEEIQTLWNVNPENPEGSNLTDFIRFLDESVEKVLLSSSGEWTVFAKAICQDQEEKPAAPKDGEPDLKEALTDMAKRAAQGALLMYDGEPLDAETQRAFEASLRVVIATLEGRRGK